MRDGDPVDVGLWSGERAVCEVRKGRVEPDGCAWLSPAVEPVACRARRQLPLNRRLHDLRSPVGWKWRRVPWTQKRRWRHWRWSRRPRRSRRHYFLVVFVVVVAIVPAARQPSAGVHSEQAPRYPLLGRREEGWAR